AMLAWSFTETYLHGRLSVDARLHGHDASDRPGGTDHLEFGVELRARDYVEYAVDTLIEGLRARLAATGGQPVLAEGERS
ncbi:MAG: hypothetical protein AB7V15_05150, partial [Acidimicrobiia bacterium]